MGVFANVKGPGDFLGRAILGDCLGRCRDVGIIERGVQAGPSMSGRAERHTLGSYGWSDFAYLGGDAIALLGYGLPLEIVHAPIIGSPP